MNRAGIALGLMAAMGCGAPAVRMPEGPISVPLVESWRPRHWVVEAEVAGKGPLLFIVHPDAEAAGLTRDAMAALGLVARGDPARGPVWVEADLALGGIRGRLRFLAVPALPRVGGREVAGVLGVGLFAPRRASVDAAAGLLHLLAPEEPQPVSPRPRLQRFADLEGCGPDLLRCVRPIITAVSPGRVELGFAQPAARLPARYAARVQVDPSTTILVQFGAHHGLPLRTSVEVPLGSSAAVGPAVVLDVVPVGRACVAHLCRR